jgi:hypothetical protein
MCACVWICVCGPCAYVCVCVDMCVCVGVWISGWDGEVEIRIVSVVL